MTINLSKQAALSTVRLHELVTYDPEIGIMAWKRDYGRNRAGNEIGSLSRFGHRFVMIDRRLFAVHRLIWFFVYGKWPAHEIDHINRLPGDNRLANLREANHVQNLANRRAQNGRDLKGITRKGNRWQAQIRHNNRNLFLGLFDTPEQASAAYLVKARELHGEFAWMP